MALAARARQLLPYVNFLVATTALAFQTTVLYPWHVQLDTAFHNLKGEQAEILKGYHNAKLRRFSQLEARMEGLERRMQNCAVTSLIASRSGLGVLRQLLGQRTMTHSDAHTPPKNTAHEY
ncbi:Mitochondrial phosphate carrier protein [Mycena venus]|uniref:Mitochondrial phosphate carrier protein n=1 Tax=Mycena venus TaxID=2733690 RepID=A0A8H7DCL1_9AGAR|nr:Mitochondrial phosphate carrier protein [Mycena venus]